jgi:hypothetical protein
MGLTKRQMSIDGVVPISSNAFTTINQGGGPNKAGLIPTKNVDHWRWIAMATAQTRNTLPNLGSPVVFGLKHTVNPNVAQSRPVGSRPQFNTYFLTGAQCCKKRGSSSSQSQYSYQSPGLML